MGAIVVFGVDRTLRRLPGHVDQIVQHQRRCFLVDVIDVVVILWRERRKNTQLRVQPSLSLVSIHVNKSEREREI